MGDQEKGRALSPAAFDVERLIISGSSSSAPSDWKSSIEGSTCGLAPARRKPTRSGEPVCLMDFDDGRIGTLEFHVGS